MLEDVMKTLNCFPHAAVLRYVAVFKFVRASELTVCCFHKNFTMISQTVQELLRGKTSTDTPTRIICLSCVHWLLKLLNDSIFVPPAAIYSLFYSFSLIHTAFAPSLSLDQQHGTCSKTTCVSQTCKLTVFVVH